jgi:hypothetical protein
MPYLTGRALYVRVSRDTRCAVGAESESEYSEEYVPMSEAELSKVNNFSRATVSVMNDASIPKAHKSRRIQQLVAVSDLTQATLRPDWASVCTRTRCVVLYQCAYRCMASYGGNDWKQRPARAYSIATGATPR